MGCFSFKCLNCGRGVRSSSFDGDEVHLFLLRQGKVIQKMTGEYDSYGRVFIDGTQDPSVKHPLRKSVQWKQIEPFSKEDKDKAKIIGKEHTVWHQITDLMNSKDITDGIAAVHVSCYKEEAPTIRSVRDPDQGWGDKKKPLKRYNPKREHEIESIQERLWDMRNKISLATSFSFLTKEPKSPRLIELEEEQKTLRAKLKKYGVKPDKV